MKALVDTNILFYAFDVNEIKKHEIASDLVKKCFSSEAYISTQNIAELYNKAKRKFSKEQFEKVKLFAMAIIKSKNWVKISYDEHTIWNAINKDSEKSDFWDLVIYFTALENGLDAIITENEKDFLGLKGIDIINPFK